MEENLAQRFNSPMRIMVNEINHGAWGHAPWAKDSKPKFHPWFVSPPHSR